MKKRRKSDEFISSLERVKAEVIKDLKIRNKEHTDDDDENNIEPILALGAGDSKKGGNAFSKPYLYCTKTKKSYKILGLGPH